MHTTTQFQRQLPEGRHTVAPVSELFRDLYSMLGAMARRRIADGPPGGALEPAAVVHEAYIRLVGPDLGRRMSRALFFHAADEEMRRVLIDDARARRAQKRGGRLRREWSDVLDRLESPTERTTTEVGDALIALGRTAPDLAALVRLRFYEGYSVDATAQGLGCSPRSIDREWGHARAWLHDRLSTTVGDIRRLSDANVASLTRVLRV